MRLVDQIHLVWHVNRLDIERYRHQLLVKNVRNVLSEGTGTQKQDCNMKNIVEREIQIIDGDQKDYLHYGRSTPTMGGPHPLWEVHIK